MQCFKVPSFNENELIEMKEIIEINVRQLGYIKVNGKKSYKKIKDNEINQWDNYNWLEGISYN